MCYPSVWNQSQLAGSVKLIARKLFFCFLVMVMAPTFKKLEKHTFYKVHQQQFCGES